MAQYVLHSANVDIRKGRQNFYIFKPPIKYNNIILVDLCKQLLLTPMKA